MASPQEQEAAMIARLPEQTGRTLDEWVKLVTARGLTAHGRSSRSSRPIMPSATVTPT